MKQFLTILKFELGNYFKNKIFVGVTIFLMVGIAVVTWIPNIIKEVQSNKTEEEQLETKDLMLIHADVDEISSFVQQSFEQAFPDYKVEITSDSLDNVKKQIVDGKAKCAFWMENMYTYTYYVNNLEIYDHNRQIADSVLQEVYRMNALLNNGVELNQAQEIMSMQMTSKVEKLGVDQTESYWYTYIMIFTLYMVILLYGQMVATNVATEKSSRAMEVLITSAKPVSMMFGKVLASCIAGLIQLIAIFGTAILSYQLNSDTLGENPVISSIFNMPIDLFIYMLIFFVLGFLVYAFLYGAIGSTATKLEDINTSVMPLTFLFVITFMIVMFSMSSGYVDSLLMKICSYIPFMSSMAMFTRIAMSDVAFYEIVISIVILIVSVIGIGIIAAKIYRVGVLLYGTTPKMKDIIKALRHS